MSKSQGKRKVRVEFRKNRGKRTRDNDLTRDFQNDLREDAPKVASPASGSHSFHALELGELEDRLTSSERVRARGDLSRKRTIVTTAEEDQEGATGGDAQDDALEPFAMLAVDLSRCEPGRVVRIHGLNSVVEADGDGRLVRCRLRRLLKTLAIDGRGVLAVGDRVWFRPDRPGGSEGFIEKVERRRGIVTRGYRKREHVLVANVDQLLIVSAFEDPGLKPGLIDRYLISAERGGVRPVIVFNKADLVDLAHYQWIVGLYAQLGYETLVTSVKSGVGLDRLRTILQRGITALSGQSGVGKSSLINAVDPAIHLKVGEVSSQTHKGKHTTTTAELIRTSSGGFVVDTPGLRQFELWGVVPSEIEGYFPEFRPLIPHCRFPDCTHTHESGCAVKEAVAEGLIHDGRYESYLKLFFQQPLEGDADSL